MIVPAPMSCYGLSMRHPFTHVLALSVLILGTAAASCGDDRGETLEAGEKPEPGSVKVWESCLWDGSIAAELCETNLRCSGHSNVCVPQCSEAEDCEVFDGFVTVCDTQGASADKVCIIMCNPTDSTCPITGGAELECAVQSGQCT